VWLVALTDFCCGPHPTPERVEPFLSEKHRFWKCCGAAGWLFRCRFSWSVLDAVVWFVLVRGSAWDRLEMGGCRAFLAWGPHAVLPV